jgi:multidrug efflux pump
VDELRRIPGVGDVRSFSSEYAMRIWLDPAKLSAYNLSPSDALLAVQEQNSQSSGGSLGDRPLAEGSELNAAILTQSRFTTPEQFANVILRADPDGSVIRLGDVARVELGAQSYGFDIEMNGVPAAGMAIQLTPGANALAAAEAVKARMEELAIGFPPDIEWSVPYDSTPFVKASVESVVETLIEAMILVFLVMYVFLQNWRATLIPTIVVPIALAGACLGLWLLGFSINVLTLFAMVMAIGILVDDAIVVIENVERIMTEEKLSPYDATVKAMTQITSAVIGITLVLVSVFVPMAFFPGTTGAIYRQFAVTLAISIAFSALMALTLTPALCATLLKPVAEHGAVPTNPVSRAMARFFAWFNDWFTRVTGRYQSLVGRILLRPLRFLAIFGALVAITFLFFERLPGSFLPVEDQGSVLTVTSYPDRTSPVVRGKWILENLLGTPPPPPVPNVPPLKPTNTEGKVLSMRERMVQHRASPVCASCHALMDPLGLALENFDAVGKFRTLGEGAAPIDATGNTPDGNKFDGVAGLRQALLGNDRFITTLTEKLFVYALGRGLEYYDQPAVRAVVRATKAEDYRLSSIIAAIVRSEPFRMRRAGS